MAKYKNVLLIDDDSITIFICKRMMKLANFANQITSFENGAEALNYLHDIVSQQDEEGMPDIILLDLNMQVMNGWEFLEKFDNLARGAGKFTSLYVLSSTIVEEDKKRVLSYPFVKDFILKPLKMEDLDLL